jgi:outer membrane protein assembly factor BamA
MKLRIWHLIVCVLIFSGQELIGQKTDLSLISDPEIKFKKSFNSPKSAETYLKNKLLALKKKGFSEASIDSVQSDSGSIKAYFHIGSQYKWSSLVLDSVPFEISSSLSTKVRNIEGKPFYAVESRKIGETIVSYYENVGYPFAKVLYDSVLIEDNKVQERITLNKGPMIMIDSISLKGLTKINPYVVYQLIGIKPESLYSEKKIQKIVPSLKNIAYLDVLRPPEFYFTANKNILFLYLKERKRNRFSGILGFQNNPVDDKLMLTGDLALGLNNVFKQGEWINFNWNRFQDASQKLFVNIGFPYLFKTPVGVEGGLNLFKQDSTYIDVLLEGRLLFSMNNKSRFELSVSSRQTNRLTESVSATSSLANVSLINYSLGIRHRSFDNFFNPRKGFGAIANVTIGNKSVSNLSEVDTVASNPIQYQTMVNLSYFIPTFKKQTLGLLFKGGAIFNNYIYQNEMFRLGGLTTIRGFNDESIYASQYGIGSVEYRYLYEQNANLRLFSDIGLIKNQGFSPDFNLYIGFGIGASIETKAGIFNIDYAMGKQENQTLLISDAKVHIGYVNNF